MKTRRVRLLIVTLCMTFVAGISYAQESMMVDGEIWLTANVYWAELEMIAISNMWGKDRNYLSRPNAYEHTVVSGSPPTTDLMMNFVPLPGGCGAGGCFTFATYQINISFQYKQTSQVVTKTYYIDYLDANIHYDYSYDFEICGIDLQFRLDPTHEDLVTMEYKSGFPTCGLVTTAPLDGQSFKIWELTGPQLYTPNSARHFNVPVVMTTSCGGPVCNPNRIYQINYSSPPQDPCPASGCAVTMQSEGTLTGEAYPIFQNYDQYGDMVFYHWTLPDNTYLHGINPFTSTITRALYTNLAIPLKYEAYYSYDWNPPSSQDPGEPELEKVSESGFAGEAVLLSASSYPNPFNPTTTIHYLLFEASHVSLTIFDLHGRRIAHLRDAWQEAGQYEAIWDASLQPSGLYVYRLEAAQKVLTGKMQLLK